MSHVAKDALARFSMPFLTCIGLILFLAVFAGAVLWVYRQGSREFYSSLSRLPLDREGDLS